MICCWAVFFLPLSASSLRALFASVSSSVAAQGRQGEIPDDRALSDAQHKASECLQGKVVPGQHVAQPGWHPGTVRAQTRGYVNAHPLSRDPTYYEGEYILHSKPYIIPTLSSNAASAASFRHRTASGFMRRSRSGRRPLSVSLTSLLKGTRRKPPVAAWAAIASLLPRWPRRPRGIAASRFSVFSATLAAFTCGPARLSLARSLFTIRKAFF